MSTIIAGVTEEFAIATRLRLSIDGIGDLEMVLGSGATVSTPLKPSLFVADVSPAATEWLQRTGNMQGSQIVLVMDPDQSELPLIPEYPAGVLTHDASVHQFRVTIQSALRRHLWLQQISERHHRLLRDAMDLAAFFGGDHVTAVAQSEIALDYLERRLGTMHLSAREREVLTLILEGKRVSTIASQLCVSPGTVRSHLKMMYKKFDVHSQAELIECATASAKHDTSDASSHAGSRGLRAIPAGTTGY